MADEQTIRQQLTAVQDEVRQLEDEMENGRAFLRGARDILTVVANKACETPGRCDQLPCDRILDRGRVWPDRCPVCAARAWLQEAGYEWSSDDGG